MSPSSIKVILVTLFVLALADDAGAGCDCWNSFQVQEENDLFVPGSDSDEGYTQGLLLSGIRNPEHNPRWVNRLGERLWGLRRKDAPAVFLGLEIGQHMFTPRDLRTPRLVTDDRPYAGWLYGGLVLSLNEQVRPEVHRQTQQTLELQLGIVGPESGAEHVQTWWHEVIGVQRPRGWDNQLPFEPGIQFFYQWQRRFGSPTFDWIPHVTGALGNMQIYAGGGATARLGWNLSGFPLQPNRNRLVQVAEPERARWEAWVFIGTEGRAIARNIFLDGSTFKDSHRVDSESFVYDLRGGISGRYRDFRLTYTLIRRSREFSPLPPGADGHQDYGSINLSWERAL